MEDRVFPSPAVAELLERGFVEARLHNDHQTAGEANRALQKRLVGYVAAPYYVVVDPARPDVERDEHKLEGVSDGWDSITAKFRDFLARQLAQ